MTEPSTTAQRRESILSAAERAFNTHGYANTTVDEVAAEAGVSKGSVYNYFQSKEELFGQLHEAALHGVAEDLIRISGENLPAKTRLLNALDYWYARASRWLTIGRLFLEFWATAARDRQGQISADQQTMYDRIRQVVRDLIADGIGSGEFAADLRPDVAATMILALLDGVQVQAILETGPEVDDAFLASIKRAILTPLVGRRVSEQEVQP